MCGLIFMPNRLANYTGHEVNILPGRWESYDIAPELAEPARAFEIPTIMGSFAVAGARIQVVSMAHGEPVGLPPDDQNALGIVSADTLRAVYRSPHGGLYVVPDDIVRSGLEVHGAKGVALPEVFATPNPEAVLATTWPERLPPIDEFQNFSPFPINIYLPETPDEIDPRLHAPIFSIPPSDAPTTINRQRLLHDGLSTKFKVDVFITATGDVEVVNPQFPEPGGAAFMHQEAIRAYVKVGLPVDGLFVPGGLVRDTQGKIIGCRSIMRFDPRMLAADPF